jgi:hypothetical protein
MKNGRYSSPTSGQRGDGGLADQTAGRPVTWGFGRVGGKKEGVEGVSKGYSPMAGTRRGGQNRPAVELGWLSSISIAWQYSGDCFTTGRCPTDSARRRSASGGRSFSNRCFLAPNREGSDSGKRTTGFCGGGTPVMPCLMGEVAGVQFITTVLSVASPCSGDQRARRNGDD